ncbi:MAG TPA: hypothetical protein VKY85_07690 [Candidatus Angelobacter sp.]|nr:hypothetical protein [Candidatus Angelobacter sp.]
MKSFGSVLLSFLLIFGLCVPQVGCSGSLIDTVLADLPVATDIAISVVNIVSPGNAAYVQQVTEYAGKVSADLKLIESLVGQYKANLGAAPATALGQINASLSDAQTNLSAILTAVGVADPKVTAAVAAAIASVKLILLDVGLLIRNSAPAPVTAQLFFGVGMPGVDFLAVQTSGKHTEPAPVQKPSGKSARQIAKEYNQKISKDFGKAKVNVPKMHVLGVPVPMTGGK